MKQLVVALIGCLLLSNCARNEGVSGFTDPGKIYRMTLLDGVPFDAPATLTFPQPGKVVGEAPCNRFDASQTVPYPWFGLENIVVTRRACPALAEEAAFFEALDGVTLAEVSGDALILSNPAGREMVFRAQ
ncbi:MAG: META domain-containing protein [Pseudomonadota bacterium]